MLCWMNPLARMNQRPSEPAWIRKCWILGILGHQRSKRSNSMMTTVYLWPWPSKSWTSLQPMGMLQFEVTSLDEQRKCLVSGKDCLREESSSGSRRSPESPDEDSAARLYKSQLRTVLETMPLLVQGLICHLSWPLLLTPWPFMTLATDVLWGALPSLAWFMNRSQTVALNLSTLFQEPLHLSRASAHPTPLRSWLLHKTEGNLSPRKLQMCTSCL